MDDPSLPFTCTVTGPVVLVLLNVLEAVAPFDTPLKMNSNALLSRCSAFTATVQVERETSEYVKWT